MPVISFLPPFDISWRVAAAPARLIVSGLRPPMYPRETVPSRFVGLDAGVSLQDVPSDYFELFCNPDQIQGVLTAFCSTWPMRPRERWIGRNVVNPTVTISY